MFLPSPRQTAPDPLAGGLAALSLVSGRRDADDALEVPGQVGLIGEADLRGDSCGRDALVEQQPRPPDSQLVEVGMRRQSSRDAEGAEPADRRAVRPAGL
jgi:hypothetical protein